MSLQASTAGRTSFRPVAVLGAGAAILLATTFVFRGSDRAPHRGPVAVPNDGAESAVETMVGSTTYVANTVPAESLVIDSVPPTEPSRLLFFQGRPVQPDGEGGGVTVDGAGGLLRVDAKLHVDRLMARIDGREATSVAAAPDGGLWLVTGDGEIIRVDARGEPVTDVQRGPFMYSLVASDAEGTAWLVRSPDRTGFRPVIGSTPLLAKLDATGAVESTIGSGLVPKDFLLTHLASAGRIAIADSVIYYAPFIRDEVVAITTSGDTAWVATRGLPQSKPEPRFEVIDDQPVVDYAPVNLGLAIGPDDRLYVLSVPGFITSQARLDVFDPASGRLLRTTTLDNPLPTLSVDADGRVFVIDEFALLTGIPSRERQPFAEFELQTLAGPSISSSDLRGKVVLVNFWASWCAPCRIEMPALDTLQKSIEDPDFLFVTMNDDIRPADGRAFIDEYGFDFPVLLGEGRLKAQYHYIGLPFTVLLDREGKVVERWIGFAGEAQIGGIRAVIQAELARGPGDMMDMDMSGGGMR